MNQKYLEIISLMLFLAGWELLATLVKSMLFPSPITVFLALIEMIKKGFLIDIGYSLTRFVVGTTIGCFLGLFVGVICGQSKIIDGLLTPLNLLRALPPVAMIPLFITLFGIGESAKIISIAIAVFFPVWINTVIGVKGIPIHYIHAAKIITNSKIKTVFGVIIPSSLPYSIAGIRIGIAVGFIMVYVSELAGSSIGMGYVISIMHLTYAMDKMLAALFTLGFIALIVDIGFQSGIQRVFPWLKQI